MIQIREGHTRPAFRVPGTRRLLEGLPETGFLTGPEVDELRRAHGFLRSLETFARMETDANTSAVAADPARFEVLGRRLRARGPGGRRARRDLRARDRTGARDLRNVVGRL